MIQREGKASVKANLYVPDNTGDELLTVVFPPTLFILSGQDPISQKAKSYVKDMESAGLNPEVIEYEKAVHSFIESNNPEGAVDSSVDMSDVINPEQESLAREAEATISQWIRMRYAK